MTNTLGIIQKFATVPAGKPNEGANSYEDTTEAEILEQAGLTDESKRAVITSTILASTASNTFNPDTGRALIVDMDANITSFAPSTIANQFDGQLMLFIIKEDGAGGWTMTWDATYFQAGMDQGIPVLNGTADTRDYVLCAWNAKDSKWDFLSHDRRYP